MLDSYDYRNVIDNLLVQLHDETIAHNGRVANTYNLSGDRAGYSMCYGNPVEDFSPLSKLTADEVKQIGRELMPCFEYKTV